MLPEYRDLIAQLRQSDNHFARLFDEHNALDENINRLMKDPVAAPRDLEIEEMKKKKLALKDQIYAYLQKKEKEQQG